MTYIEVFLLLGGLGMFLFGMHLMGAGLRNVAGDRLQGILDKATRRPVMGVLLGIGATVLVQSSGATTIMSIGFVGSALMTLEQSVGVIMGANIGTTVTGQIIAFHLTDIAPLIIFIGAVIFLFLSKRDRIRSVSQIILGFGLLFEGFGLMDGAVAPLKESEIVIEVLDTLSNPFLAMLIGLAVTVILQSSSSSVGIFQVFAMEGLIDVRIAVFMVIGSNIGAVVPAFLAAIGMNREGKRTAMVSLIFNVFRTVLCAALLLIFPQIFDLFIGLSASPARQIANMHSAMAVFSVLVMLPFTGQIAALSRKLIPVTEKEARTARKKLVYITNLKNVPVAIALSQARLEMIRMAHLSEENLREAIENFFDPSQEAIDMIAQREEVVDYLCYNITGALVAVDITQLSEQQLNQLGGMIRCTEDFERVSDHAQNIAEYAQRIISEKLPFTADGLEDMRMLSDKAMKAVSMSVRIYEDHEYSLIEESYRLEAEVDDLNDLILNHHTARLMRNECDPRSGVVYTEMATDLERAADHAHNVVKGIDGVAVPIA